MKELPRGLSRHVAFAAYLRAEFVQREAEKADDVNVSHRCKMRESAAIMAVHQEGILFQ